MNEEMEVNVIQLSAKLAQINEIKDCHPKVTAYYFKEWNGFEMDFHTHRAIEIMYVISGECLVEIDSVPLLMKKNQFVLIESRVPHRLIVEKGKPCRMLNIEFALEDAKREFPTLHQLMNESFELKEFTEEGKPYYYLKDTNGVLHTLKNLVFELDMRRSANNNNFLMVQLLITQLLLLIARNIIEEKNKSIDEKDIYVKQIIKYLHENYDYDIKMEQISEEMHLHANYLHRIFKESMNCTIMSYLNDIRIEKARLLLSQTDIPITEIAGFIGMNSSQYFSKVFKQQTGLTPTGYRKKHHNTSRIIEPY